MHHGFAALGFGLSALGARPDPIIAIARISTTAPGDSSALVPTALHAGYGVGKNS